MAFWKCSLQNVAYKWCALLYGFNFELMRHCIGQVRYLLIPFKNLFSAKDSIFYYIKKFDRYYNLECSKPIKVANHFCSRLCWTKFIFQWNTMKEKNKIKFFFLDNALQNKQYWKCKKTIHKPLEETNRMANQVLKCHFS